MVANRTGESPLSGMKRGALGNVVYGGIVNPSRNRKGGNGNPPPKGWHAPVLSQPPQFYPDSLNAHSAGIQPGTRYCLLSTWRKRSPHRPETRIADRGKGVKSEQSAKGVAHSVD